MYKTGINNRSKGGINLKDVIDFEKRERNIADKTNKKNLNKKRLVVIIVIIVLAVVIGITMLLYYSSRDVRNFLDQYLFRKNVTQEKLEVIDLDFNSNISVFAYNKYICVLAENKLMEYNSSGNLENEINLEINNPVYGVNNKYLAISEKNGTKLNLISGSEILWTKDVDGNISKINVNENGYVSVIITGTTYKSVIIVFDNNGNELFKVYLATTIAIDTSISNDNKYLAYAEANTNGTAIRSNIKVMSIDRAKNDQEEPTIYTYSADNNKLIVNIEYHRNGQIICMYDSEISSIKDNTNTVLINLVEKDKSITFSNINLDNYIYRAIEENDGLFNTNTILEIKGTSNDRTVTYTVEGVAKDIYSFNNIIAINLGQEVEFINTSGWLLKRYSSLQEVQNVIIGNGIAGIVYKDQVEIINL